MRKTIVHSLLTVTQIFRKRNYLSIMIIITHYLMNPQHEMLGRTNLHNVTLVHLQGRSYHNPVFT